MTDQEYYNDFMQNIYALSGAREDFTESAFTERMCEFLTEQAVIDNFTIINYKKTGAGIRADAWNLDTDSEVLCLLATDYHPDKTLQTLTQTDVDKHFQRLEKYFLKSLQKQFYSSLEESTPAYEASRSICENASRISRVALFILSNASLSSRVQAISDREDGKFLLSYDIWDIGRLARLEMSGKAREDIEIDLREYEPEGVPYLPAFSGSNGCQSYLMAFPGEVVASLYDRYGERLLEQNVRTFLQFRGGVNKGIRTTILNEPSMFFAYNNGLTVTAERIDESKGRLIGIKNLQIVNGGQTTASLFHAMRKNRADLSEVYVQVKMNVIAPDEVEEVVPKISQFANTQNKVNAADFFSNHPFHLRMEETSRRLWAPSRGGGQRETHWYYERARGQYANAQAKMTPAQQKQFLIMSPKAQMFTKTDLAKFENSMGMLPHVVSKGAQYNFAQFANDIGQQWESNESRFNELYFKNAVAQAIIFHYVDQMVLAQPWYGGYKANIVTYTMAKLAHLVSYTGKHLDLAAVWKRQEPTEALKTQLCTIAPVINDLIQQRQPGNVAPPLGGGNGESNENVTQYCKQLLCWQKIRDYPMALIPELGKELLGREEAHLQEHDAEKEQHIVTGILAQERVLELGASHWISLKEWNAGARVCSPKEASILDRACTIPSFLPSEKQAAVLLELEKRAVEEGFIPPETNRSGQ